VDVTLQDLQTLLDYHYWARDRLLEALAPLSAEQYTRDMGSSFKSIRDTSAHIYSSEWAWYSRWQGTSPTAQLPPDQFPDVASLRSAWAAQERKTRAFVDGLGEEGVTRLFDFTLLSGQLGSAVFWQMLQHLVNHASYHRGQITTMLRQMGARPAQSMDMIAFHRSRTQA
jgi:uncharacterized damage-inducible protein DinB